MNIFTSNQDLFYKTTMKLYLDPEFRCKPRNIFIHEDLGFSARINNPKDRLLFIPERHWDIVYGVGEFLWYVTGSNDLSFIQYYAPSYKMFSDDRETLYGAYGTRLFKSPSPEDTCVVNNTSYIFHVESDIRSVIRKLRIDPDSRQALAVIWREHDMHVLKTKDLPCTISLQFFIRNNKLCMITNMRSNDIWLGATNDVFCFTMIQELIASELGIDIHFYQHNTGSMHLYDRDIEKINNSTTLFSNACVSFPMNKIDRFHEQIRHLIRYEKELRKSDIEFQYQSLFIKKINNSISDGIHDLMTVLYYGKIRQIYKKDQPELFKDMLQNKVLEEIKDSAIRECIKIYEEDRREKV